MGKLKAKDLKMVNMQYKQHFCTVQLYSYDRHCVCGGFVVHADGKRYGIVNAAGMGESFYIFTETEIVCDCDNIEDGIKRAICSQEKEEALDHSVFGFRWSTSPAKCINKLLKVKSEGSCLTIVFAKYLYDTESVMVALSDGIPIFWLENRECAETYPDINSWEIYPYSDPWIIRGASLETRAGFATAVIHRTLYPPVNWWDRYLAPYRKDIGLPASYDYVLTGHNTAGTPANFQAGLREAKRVWMLYYEADTLAAIVAVGKETTVFLRSEDTTAEWEIFEQGQYIGRAELGYEGACGAYAEYLVPVLYESCDLRGIVATQGKQCMDTEYAEIVNTRISQILKSGHKHQLAWIQGGNKRCGGFLIDKTMTYIHKKDGKYVCCMKDGTVLYTGNCCKAIMLKILLEVVSGTLFRCKMLDGLELAEAFSTRRL